MSEFRNRLAAETSPYLLQHATNPVDWYAWGPEALERARREDKPIFLSIGYAACHWCHVMERESFENLGVADFLNRYFVSIKVDREERPDLDDIYMAATVALSGSGGWPMSVFLTPTQEPFFAGTYFPPSDRYGRPGFLTLLQRIVELWQNERDAALEQARQLTEHVRLGSSGSAPLAIPAERLTQAATEFGRSFDRRFGGFGSAPKFPPHQGLRLLLREHRRSGDQFTLEMVVKTLDGMKNGGIYDQLAGGFARYSTDERWLLPHFEKMLYDNAQLASVYLEAYQVTRSSEYRRVATETLDYVAREMQSPDGGYFSATDADSEGEEGKFFVFTPEDLDDVLTSEEKDAFCTYYDVSAAGNWEGKSVLNTPRPLERVADELGKDEARLRELLDSAKRKALAARLERVPPLLDDKILTAWNGLMIEAMAEGCRVLGERKYLDSAERAARFILEKLTRDDGGLYRTARKGKAHIPAFLEDYAYFSDALVSLYEASGRHSWLEHASRLAERMISDFGREAGGFFNTAETHESLIARVREGHDGALPSANSLAARALARLSFHLDRDDLSARASDAIVAYGKAIERSPRAFASALSVCDFLLQGPTELVLVGPSERADTRALLEALAQHFLPNRVLALVDPETPSDTPLTRGKSLIEQQAALYVCRNFTCQAPITSAYELDAALTADAMTREPIARLAPSEA